MKKLVIGILAAAFSVSLSMPAASLKIRNSQEKPFEYAKDLKYLRENGQTPAEYVVFIYGLIVIILGWAFNNFSGKKD